MAMWGNQAYTTSGVSGAISDIIYVFTRHLLSSLPKGIIEDDSLIMDIPGYKTTANHTSEGTTGPARIAKPSVKVTIEEQSDLWSTENNGPLTNQYSMFPGTTKDRSLQNKHNSPMLRDNKAGMLLDSIELHRKVTLKYQFETSTPADAYTLESLLHNTLRINVESTLKNMYSKLILPNGLMYDIAKILYKKDDITFDKTFYDSFQEKITSSMVNSNLNINIVKNEDNDGIWFEMLRLFDLNYRLFKIEGKEHEKKGEVYDKSIFELRCTLGFKLPNSYIMNYKAFNTVNGCTIDPYYINNMKLDVDAGWPIAFTEPRYIEDRDYIPDMLKSEKTVVKEEFLAVGTEDMIIVSDFLPKNSIYLAMFERLTPKELCGNHYGKDITKNDDKSITVNHIGIHDTTVKPITVLLFENGSLIDDEFLTIDFTPGDMLVGMLSLNHTESTYTIFINIDEGILVKNMDKIIKRFENDVYPNKDSNGDPIKLLPEGTKVYDLITEPQLLERPEISPTMFSNVQMTIEADGSRGGIESWNANIIPRRS